MLWLLLALPAFALIYQFDQDLLFYGEMLHISGELSARLLLLTLCIAPLRRFFPRTFWTGWLLASRRYFGVAAFSYGTLHTVVYLQKQATLQTVVDDALRVEMWTGWLALFIFLALALTSNDASVRWLKSTWKALHRWVYVAAVLTFAHWILIAFNILPGIVHLLILVLILSLRFVKRSRPSVSEVSDAP
jgi:sulfoxide reductase heme-binding subunit YedZ